MIDWWLNKCRLCTTLWCSSNSGVPMRRCLSGCRRRFRCCRYCCTCCRLSCGCCAGCCGDWIHFCRKQLTHWCKGIGFLINIFLFLELNNRWTDRQGLTLAPAVRGWTVPRSTVVLAPRVHVCLPCPRPSRQTNTRGSPVAWQSRTWRNTTLLPLTLRQTPPAYQVRTMRNLFSTHTKKNQRSFKSIKFMSRNGEKGLEHLSWIALRSI